MGCCNPPPPQYNEEARMCSTSEDVQYKSSTSIFSTNKDVQKEVRQIFSANEDVQYEQAISSVQMRMCSTNKRHHQALRKKGANKSYI